MEPSVEYLGYRVDTDGLHAIDKMVEAIRSAPALVNQQQLRSFVGMVNYYVKFVSNYATITQPLNELLHKDAKWKWCKVQQKAGAPVFMHYDAELPLLMLRLRSRSGYFTYLTRWR